MPTFQESCNVILDDPNIFEEDKVDKLEKLVIEKYTSLTADQIERIIMNIMWKHRDPTKGPSKPQIVKVEEIVTKTDIPSIERRLELEKQFLELEALNDRNNQYKKNYKETTREQDKLESEYKDLLKKTEDLRIEIYGDMAISSESIKVSPIDHIINMFGGTVSRQRVEQALKSTGYSVIDASTLILNQIKKLEQSQKIQESNTDAINKPEKLFNPEYKNNVVCSFFAKNGQCLRSDCKFSHNVEDKVCSFWLKGNCLASDSCLFKHDLGGFDISSLPPTAESTIGNNNSSGLSSASSNKPKFDFKSIPSFVSSSPIQIAKPIKKPILIPWETSTDTHLKKYLSHRNNAFKFENNRKRYAQQSTAAWKANNGEKAKKMSEKANEFEDKALDELKLADDELYEYSETQKEEAWFEMHGLEFKNAIEQLNTNLQEVRSKHPKNSKTVYLVVPSSTNYSEYKKVTKPVTIWLDHEGFRWKLFNYNSSQFGSILALDPWPL